MTGGDVDADWEDAYAVGDEAPGGDNPTPDQDRVDDIGRALGIEYQDNEELKAADKIAERDRHRWELDPASAEDYKKDRTKTKALTLVSVTVFEDPTRLRHDFADTAGWLSDRPPRQHSLYHLLDRHSGGVDDRRIGRDRERRADAWSRSVAFGQRGRHL